MIRTRHRLLAYLACAVALGVAQQASAQVNLPAGTPGTILPYNTVAYYSAINLGGNNGGYININNSAVVVPTANFTFIPNSIVTANLYGSPGLAETGDQALHDAIYQGYNPNDGLWNGESGFTSSTAANQAAVNGDFDTGIGYINNSRDNYTSFEGFNLTTCQIPGQPPGTYYSPTALSIVSVALIGDTQLTGNLPSSGDFGDVTDGELGLLGPMGGGGESDGTSVPEWQDGNFFYEQGLGSDDTGAITRTELDSPASPTWNSGDPGGGYDYAFSTIKPSGNSLAVVPEPSCIALLLSLAIPALVVSSIRRLRAAAAR